ncbi:hypothetical protein ACFE04_031723 [Oxalis oulophora]
MGQNLNTMNHHHKNEELLHQLVCSDDVEGIKALCREDIGVNLEWMDSEGKTPLIIACRNGGLINVAKTLIQMGANIHAYRPGRKAGTPLHHAAKRGLDQTVNLLLSSGANALLRNDDGHTALDIARAKGFTTVVRAIETHICYFSGWLREFYAPGFLQVLAPQFLSRQIWAVIIPRGAANPLKSPKFELAIYSNLQDAQPRQIIALWKANIKEPDFNHSDPALSIFDQFTKTRFKLASANEGDKTQLYQLCNACKGIRQVTPSDAQTSIATSAPQANSEATVSNSNGWGDSSEVVTHNGWSVASGMEHSESSSSGWFDEGPTKKEDYNGWIAEPAKENFNGWGEHHSRGNPRKREQTLGKDDNGWGEPHSRPNEQDQSLDKNYNEWAKPSNPKQESDTIAKDSNGWTGPNHVPGGSTATISLTPSAPPIPEGLLDEGPINYPLIDSNPVHLSVPTSDSVKQEPKDDQSSCVLCWEAPVEGALVPCGHMAGCMSCLNLIKAKKGVCPLCRVKIDQVQTILQRFTTSNVTKQSPCGTSGSFLPYYGVVFVFFVH